jgi:hypothetical protein
MKLDPRAFAPLKRDEGMPPVTPVTRAESGVLPLKASGGAVSNTVTPVTREKHKSESNLAENGGIQTAFQIRAAGKQFTMVIPGGSTRDEAWAEARMHWPDAEVI